MVANVSDLSKALKVSSAGMAAQNSRLLVISQNIANAQSMTANGTPYRRKVITFKNEKDPKHGVDVVKIKAINHDKTPFTMAYKPNHPNANAQGMVAETNVKPLIEFADMREAGLTHQANLKSYEKTLNMMQETISLLKGQ